MAKLLQIKFKNEAGKNVTLKLNFVSGNLSQETVEATMNGLAELNLFKDKDGNLIYKEPVSAKYVETVSTVVVPPKA